MRAFTEEYVTVAQAAALLRVNPSTIRRWVRQGAVPAYRVGQRRVALKRADLSKLISHARGGEEDRGEAERLATEAIPRPTPEQRRQALAAVENAERLQAEILARRGGKPFSPSWELLNEARDERSRDLA